MADSPGGEAKRGQYRKSSALSTAVLSERNACAERAQDNAMQIARWLVTQPKAASVRYIGLPSHPQHEIAKRQMKGFGSMIASNSREGLKYIDA